MLIEKYLKCTHISVVFKQIFDDKFVSLNKNLMWIDEFYVKHIFNVGDNNVLYYTTEDSITSLILFTKPYIG